MSDHDEGRLTFPDLPRMELDELLGQLVERAQEVIGTQGRLRGLLRASRMVTSDLALPTLLRRIAEAARDLLGARYAALGVIAPGGRQLAEFVHTGMDPETVALVGRLPEGKGLLGALIDDPRPIRLSRIADDLRSSGFPDHHPPMNSFLGVPILVRGVVFGNLYLTECEHGGFTAEDEELALALAATAGQAIDNARLYETARKQQEWLRASAVVSRELLGSGPERALALIAEYTRDLADADLVTVLRPAGEDRLRVEVAVGAHAEDVIGLEAPADRTLSGRVFRSGQPHLGSWEDHPDQEPAVASRVNVDAVLVVPLTGAQEINGVLTAARVPGRPRFTAEDLEMAAGFATQASVSIEIADARAEQHQNELYEERDQIAAELHEQVIQRVYAVSLSLQTVIGLAKAPTVAQRVRAAVRDLDGVIAHVQDAVRRLDAADSAHRPGVRERIEEVLADVTAEHRLSVSTRFAGKLDVIGSGELADDLIVVLRDTLGLIVRHAAATAVDLVLTCTEEQVSLVMEHHGGGDLRRGDIAEWPAVAERARHRGGAAELDDRAVRWSVPLR
ncbi:GAF domain-containing protein [Amycolatopsis mongoliensis]|uniref:GAF domain-containing protein n=1 Tax=Amycolatopsis mongoliensis TaxID=715475 RepID=A0A9Y2JQT2_9PSEU|nr:GAF domain-containing protein [Amycolatopsis sp. 4-36]WIY02960.1 GAF domain-containing protein [Amycolatopsis sp. 4-36]